MVNVEWIVGLPKEEINLGTSVLDLQVANPVLKTPTVEKIPVPQLL